MSCLCMDRGNVAGTVAAVNNNGVGVCGVAGGTGNNDGVRLMSCQVLQGEDFAEIPEVADAINYARNTVLVRLHKRRCQERR